MAKTLRVVKLQHRLVVERGDFYVLRRAIVFPKAHNPNPASNENRAELQGTRLDSYLTVRSDYNWVLMDDFSQSDWRIFFFFNNMCL